MREMEREERERLRRAEEMSSLAAEMPGSQYGGEGAASVSSSIESKVEAHNTVRLSAGASLEEAKSGEGEVGADEDEDEDLLGSDVDIESVSGDEGGRDDGEEDVDEGDDDDEEDAEVVYVAEEEGDDAEEDEEWSAKEKQLQEELKRTTRNCRTLRKTMEQMRKTLGKTGKKAADEIAAVDGAASVATGTKANDRHAGNASKSTSSSAGTRQGFGAQGGSAVSPLAKAAARARMHSEIAEDDEDETDEDDDDFDEDDTDDESEGYTSDELGSLEDEETNHDDLGDDSGPSDALSPVGGRLSDRIADLRRRLRAALGDERFEAA